MLYSNYSGGTVAQLLLDRSFTDSGPATTFSIGNLVLPTMARQRHCQQRHPAMAPNRGSANVGDEALCGEESGNPTGSALATTITMPTDITASTACPRNLWWWW